MPDSIRMSAMMAGMAPTVSYPMMSRGHACDGPAQADLLGAMSLGMMIGFATAHPFNMWMVNKGLRHGLMTERPGQAQD